MPLRGKSLNSRKIKELALAMGFDEAGITRPALLEEGERAIEAWVREGRHGSMKYLEDFRNRRDRFFKKFGGAKSIIVLGVNYYTRHPEHSEGSKGYEILRPFGAQNDKEVRGRVARYAWGKDYHEVIRRKHAELISKLREEFGRGFQAQSCVDTQPIPERFAAVKSGFGFLGKHTILLSQKFGPWLFLSEIVTNLELEEDTKTGGDCGTCTHCQTICPTGALDEDYKIDARRCIAYLTIEHKGVIERKFRPYIKDWIFGCDECLNICPFTSKSKETTWKEFRPSEGAGQWLDIKELFEISSNHQYEKRFRHTALLRTNRKQMMRNACLVLANSGKEEAIPYLEKALSDSSPLVRLHAAWGLGQFRNAQTQKILEEHYKKEKDSEVRDEIDEVKKNFRDVLRVS